MPKEKKPKQWVRVYNNILLLADFLVVLTLTLADSHTAYVNPEQYTVYL